MDTRGQILKELSRIYEMGSNQLVLVSGNIRCEKEQLISAFLKDKKYFYYRCRNASFELQRSMLSAEVEKTYDIKITKNTIDECFNRIRSGDGSKLVVVLDEFQSVGRRNTEFIESVLKLRDKKLYPGPVMIILATSSLAYADEDAREIFGDSYNKIDHILKVSDYTFLEFVRAFPGLSVKGAVEAYGIIGGCPTYLARWNGSLSTKDNIIKHILSRGGFLYDEAQNFIYSELRELSVYNTILYSMAIGNEKLNDIYRFTGYSRAKISVYMKNLASFDVVEKIVSFDTGGWDNAKKGVYRIKNHYVDFWFRFIYPHLSELATMDAESFYTKFIEPDLQSHLRRYFSQVCLEYLSLLNVAGRLPVKAVRIGTWIGKEGTIDIVASDDEREIICGKCNWDSPMFTMADYESLLSDMKLARIKAKGVYLFSAQTFAPELIELSKNDSSIVLVDMTEL